MATSRLKAGGAALGMAIALIGGFEGYRNYAYKDVIGVWTACYGETRGIKPGMTFTKAECDAQFARGLQQFEQGMRKCLDKPDDVPIKPYIAYLSLAYNVGTGAFCKSSVARLANAGLYAQSCDRFLVFNKAGGRVIQGLKNRREAERKFCRSGA